MAIQRPIIVVVAIVITGISALSQERIPIVRKLNSTQLQHIATKVTVRVTAGNDRLHHDSTGSGVWVSDEGYVATCDHVVRNKASIVVGTAMPNLLLGGDGAMVGNFWTYEAKIVASDPDADVAILKLTKANPFKDEPRVISATPTSKVLQPRPQVATMAKRMPQVGSLTMLAGFPLSNTLLLLQLGNVAGTTVMPEIAVSPHASSRKLIRILLSLVSNPANSGGPVLDESGHLIGLLEGNLLSRMKDERGRFVLYVRPKRDDSGQVLTDPSGSVQGEVAPLMQNSGLSVVVPVNLAQALLDEGKRSEK